MSFRENFEAYKAFIQNNEKIKQNHKKYYLVWAELFLDYLEKHDAEEFSKGEQLSQFSTSLRENPKFKYWQINQAIDAINLFFTMVSDQEKKSFISLDSAIEQIHDIIKIKHYSKRTERSYVHWIKQFHSFINKNLIICESIDVKKFLTYLTKESIPMPKESGYGSGFSLQNLITYTELTVRHTNITCMQVMFKKPLKKRL